MLEEQIAKHYKHINVKHDKLYLIDLSDIHVGSKGFDEKSFKNTVSALAKVENVLVILGGDSYDNAVKGSKTSPFEQAIVSPREQVMYFEELVKPIKHKIIGKIDGNHDGKRAKEFNDFSLSEHFCYRNNVTYFEDYAIFHFSIGKCAFTTYVHHRSGSSGKKLNLNKLQEIGEQWRCDIIFGEHTHKRHFGSEVYIDIDTRNKKPIVREQFFVNTNSFLNWSGYAIEQGYRPCKTGANVVELTGGRAENRRIRVMDFDTFVELNGIG